MLNNFINSHASRYNTLHFASKVVCQRGNPFGNPRQQNRRYAALSGSIPPFVVSSPFHGLFSPFVKFGVPPFGGICYIFSSASFILRSVQNAQLRAAAISEASLSIKLSLVIFPVSLYLSAGRQRHIRPDRNYYVTN